MPGASGATEKAVDRLNSPLRAEPRADRLRFPPRRDSPARSLEPKRKRQFGRRVGQRNFEIFASFDRCREVGKIREFDDASGRNRRNQILPFA